MDLEPPSASGLRLPWSSLPTHIVGALENWLGAPIQSVVTQTGGFSPGVVARVRSANGRRAFLKATNQTLNPDAPGIYRQEARIVAQIPVHAPVPRLVWSIDEGDPGWIVLVFEDIEGRHPSQPWRPDELRRVVAALADMWNALTPAPINPASAVDKFAVDICGWQELLDYTGNQLDPWSVRHLGELADLEQHAPEAAAGNTLLQFDIRADNMLLTPDRVFVVDWPHACVGSSWVDLVGFAPSVTMQGGPPPEDLLALYPPALSAPPQDVMAVVASLAGYFTHRSLEPEPPGLPGLRAFQAAQGEIARAWLARLTGWS